MDSGSFLTGIEGLTEWLGYLILPTLAGFCIVMAIYAYREGLNGERHMVAAILCLMGPACALLISAWITKGAPSTAPGADGYAGALMNALNWVGNVIMPLAAAYNVARAILQHEMKHFNSVESEAHYYIVAFACLSVSGILRLLEHFVLTAKAVTLLQFYIHISGGIHSCLYV
jgi:peptidoglycan/LPS O-acetylase OafA/YrhL